MKKYKTHKKAFKIALQQAEVTYFSLQLVKEILPSPTQLKLDPFHADLLQIITGIIVAPTKII